MNRPILAAVAVIGAELALAGSFLLAGALGPLHGIAQASPLQTCDQPSACTWSVEIDGTTFDVKGCDFEDGNPDGMPCLWRDPDTGTMFYNDGSNYADQLARQH